MAEHGLTPEEILGACSTILDDLASDIHGYLPAANPSRLGGIRTRFIARMQHDIDENVESYSDLPEILDLATELMAAIQLDPASVHALTNTRMWLERRISMGRGYIDTMKRDMRFHVFDPVHFFLENNGDADLGYDVPFPRGYEPPPKVTMVGMKVTAGN
ncbi:hypothetical protein PMIN01_06078 [Paraphaeosphaeria minitans]|uniref:Uncharacterized protein n=1 Tax=Paraphaeosphaeria minitans TaxID=565426 RepID=A0A9P6KQV5_9PLEO|nr:hypothetical protein PMIN01_06078 [Paraphaeosphaeria minitans]